MAARSIRRELVGWLSAGMLVAIAIAAIATYLRAREEANEIFDYQLKQMSASLTGVPLAGAPPGSAPGAEALIVQVWELTELTDIKGHHVAASADNPEFLVESDKTGAEAAHKPAALKKTTKKK